MQPIFTIPTGFVSSTLGYVTQVFSELSPFIILILGVMLALIAVEFLLHAIRPKQ